uniref:Arabidopsis retrotransposon Orf1 C-terminal domain-containing protein n=1 Tax=Arabidopsis thaliana TaxID=3702 RepID=Q0WLV8_ARATH|nr:hypothetical protein [Arabidopsis thaliana]
MKKHLLKKRFLRKRLRSSGMIHQPLLGEETGLGGRESQPSEYYQYLKELKFEGTRYPHKETMQELGICGDVEYLMELANLATFMSCQCGGYKEESCQLFATLKVHFCLGEDSRHV